jgi:rSAM/selenodomain-associated transferase 2
MISVIVPTFNEEKNICELLQHLQGCDNYEQLEVMLCDSPRSSDDGLKKAGELGAKMLKSPEGYRAFQMNYAAQQASYDILYFLHADARPPKSFVSQILNALQRVDFGIFAYKFNSKSFFLMMNSFFTRFDGLFAGGGDQSLFIKAEAFRQIGGFDNSLRIMEDFDIYRRAKKSKLKFEIVREPLLVSARKYEQNSWIKVNAINLAIFMIYCFNGSQEMMLALNSKLSS